MVKDLLKVGLRDASKVESKVALWVLKKAVVKVASMDDSLVAWMVILMVESMVEL